MANQEQEFIARLQATFRMEADEHLRAISAGLLELEKTSDPPQQHAIIETVFRDAHSLKGAARAVNFSEIEALCQAVEGLFATLKRGEVVLSAPLFDALHKALDILEMLLHGSAAAAPALQNKEIQELLGQFAAPHHPTAVPVSVPHHETLQPAAVSEAPVLVPPIPLAPKTQATDPVVHSVLPAAVPSAPTHKASPVATPISDKPILSEMVRISRAKLDALLLQTEEMLAVKLALRQRVADLHGVKLTLDPWRKAWAGIAPEMQPLRQFNSDAGPAQKQSMATAKLLDYLDWNHTCLMTLESRLKDLDKMLEQDVHSVGSRVDDLLEGIKKAVMMPCSTLLELFPKLIRDLSRDQGKEVDLVVRGGEVEIDRRILDEMKDPLIHLLRNCIDHGIEKPEDRVRQSKPPCGTATITIAQIDSTKVEIIVSDDGAGIDVNRVKQAAIARDLITAEAAGNLREQDLLTFIFESDVSTSPIVTTVSGRGLGLAIVREKVEKLGGRITVATQPGHGSTFNILLPMALATFRGILVRAAERDFIIPIASAQRVIRVQYADIKTVENRATIIYDGRPVSLAMLGDTLELPGKSRKGDAAVSFPAVVLVWADKRIVFGVDEILYEQEVLTRELGRQLLRVRNISGATVLGSGKVVPILNVPDLMKTAMKAVRRPGASAEDTPAAAPQRHSILIVEDSITSRMLLKNILESAGYQVKTAVDGVEAFTILRTETFDLVVSDVEMPRMNGFDLTAKIRHDKKLGNLPVILVTALESREHKERGIDVGANAYIVKSSFDQSNLLDTIRRLL